MVNLPQSQQQFVGSLFVSFLRQGSNLEAFREIIGKYILQCMSMNHTAGFKKALSVYQNFGAGWEERRGSM